MHMHMQEGRTVSPTGDSHFSLGRANGYPHGLTFWKGRRPTVGPNAARGRYAPRRGKANPWAPDKSHRRQGPHDKMTGRAQYGCVTPIDSLRARSY